MQEEITTEVNRISQITILQSETLQVHIKKELGGGTKDDKEESEIREYIRRLKDEILNVEREKKMLMSCIATQAQQIEWLKKDVEELVSEGKKMKDENAHLKKQVTTLVEKRRNTFPSTAKALKQIEEIRAMCHHQEKRIKVLEKDTHIPSNSPESNKRNDSKESKNNHEKKQGNKNHHEKKENESKNNNEEEKKGIKEVALHCLDTCTTLATRILGDVAVAPYELLLFLFFFFFVNE
jgi:hypothetical protein